MRMSPEMTIAMAVSSASPDGTGHVVESKWSQAAILPPTKWNRTSGF